MADISGEDWIKRSQRGEVCSVVGCTNKPANQCDTCKSHICSDHLATHLHIFTDEEAEEKQNKDGEN
jgi:hypothetical protein